MRLASRFAYVVADYESYDSFDYGLSHCSVLGTVPRQKFERVKRKSRKS